MEDVLVNGHEGTLFVPDDPQDMSLLTWIDPDIQFTFSENYICDDYQNPMSENTLPFDTIIFE